MSAKGDKVALVTFPDRTTRACRLDERGHVVVLLHGAEFTADPRQFARVEPVSRSAVAG